MAIEVFKVFKCDSCGEYKEDAPPLRQCSNANCETVFASEDRACPDCNRTFTRRLAEHGCEDCATEDGVCEEVDAYVCENEDCDIDGNYHETEAAAVACGKDEEESNDDAEVVETRRIVKGPGGGTYDLSIGGGVAVAWADALRAAGVARVPIETWDEYLKCASVMKYEVQEHDPPVSGRADGTGDRYAVTERSGSFVSMFSTRDEAIARMNRCLRGFTLEHAREVYGKKRRTR